MSRFFTYHTGHFPNNSAYIEVTDDDRWFTHLDDGTARENTDTRAVGKLPRVHGALLYVQNGNWIEITDRIDEFRAALAARDAPATVMADHW